jgi:putative transcriptional regulator
VEGFLCLKRFYWFIIYLKFIKKIIVMISEKLIKGQLLIAEPSISGDLSFNRS